MTDTDPTFEAKQEARFRAFLNSEIDDFDLYAVPDAAFPWAAGLAHGFAVTSAGGMAPFQANGTIDAEAAHGASMVPMHWYYRSRHGVATLRVALTLDDCYGPRSGLFEISRDEIDEFDYSHWAQNIVAMIPALEEVLEPRVTPSAVPLARHPFRLSGPASTAGE